MGLSFDDSICAKLSEDYGGHPFLIRHVCSTIHKISHGKRPIRIDPSLYDAAKKEFAIESDTYIEMMIDVLKEAYCDEYDMATFLANGELDEFERLAELEPTLVSHLIGYGIIRKGHTNYYFNMDLIKSYLERIHKYERTNLTQDEKRREISSRRNRIEQKIRKIIRHVVVVKNGRAGAVACILSSIQSERRPKLESLEIDVLLGEGASPLYFLDLINIIRKHWDTFGNVFDMDKDRLLTMLNFISKQRADAHAKNIADMTFREIRVYFENIEKAISSWDNSY